MRSKEQDQPVDELTDSQLQARTESAILADAVYSTEDSRAEVDACYAECARRSRGIYQRAWNQIAREQGYSSWVQPVETTKP